MLTHRLTSNAWTSVTKRLALDITIYNSLMIAKVNSSQRSLNSLACKLSPEFHFRKEIYLKSLFLVNQVVTCCFNWLVCFSQLSSTTGDFITELHRVVSSLSIRPKKTITLKRKCVLLSLCGHRQTISYPATIRSSVHTQGEGTSAGTSQHT